VEEEEETLGQLRDRVVLASARAAVPGPRATFVHIKVEDSTSGEDTDREWGGGDGEGGEGDRGETTGWAGDGEVEGEEGDKAEQVRHREQHAHAPGASFEGRIEAGADAVVPLRRARPPSGSYADTSVQLDTDDDYCGEKEEDEEEEEEQEKEWVEAEEEPRDQRAHVPGASLTEGGSGVVNPKRMAPRVRSESGLPRARLRAPGSVADNAVQDHDDGEEEGAGPELVMCRGAGRAGGSSQFKGVTWRKNKSKWVAQCKGNHLGYHTTEESAAHAYNQYLKDGIVPQPVERGGHGTSQFKGVC